MRIITYFFSIPFLSQFISRQHEPCLIFMDEIDSIGSKRTESKGGENEVQRTMMELLNQLDGFEPSNRIKIIMATNRIDILDPALLRPGRIDRKIEFPHPNEAVSGIVRNGNGNGNGNGLGYLIYQ